MKKCKMIRKWYCYICGKILGNEFFLWSMNDRTDRIFLLCTNKYCYDQIEGKDVLMIKVGEKEGDV